MWIYDGVYVSGDLEAVVLLSGQALGQAERHARQDVESTTSQDHDTFAFYSRRPYIPWCAAVLVVRLFRESDATAGTLRGSSIHYPFFDLDRDIRFLFTHATSIWGGFTSALEASTSVARKAPFGPHLGLSGSRYATHVARGYVWRPGRSVSGLRYLIRRLRSSHAYVQHSPPPLAAYVCALCIYFGLCRHVVTRVRRGR